MASISVAGDTSGSITIQAPAVSGTNTLTLPASTGTVMVNGPAFSAYQASAQSGIANFTFTKINLQTEEFDTNNNFDSTTNYRFTPTVAGYYQVNGQVISAGSALGSSLVSIYKNGTRFKDGTCIPNDSGIGSETTVFSLIYMNGSTDYLELYFIQTTGSAMTLVNNPPSSNYFQASMVRGA